MRLNNFILNKIAVGEFVYMHNGLTLRGGGNMEFMNYCYVFLKPL